MFTVTQSACLWSAAIGRLVMSGRGLDCYIRRERREFGQRTTMVEAKKRVLITGATSGIGLETACQLAQCGHHVTITARSPQKAAVAETAIRKRAPSTNISHIVLELSSLASVSTALNHISNLPLFDVVILNAGIMFPDQKSTENDVETTFQVNYLSHFLLCEGILAQRPPSHHVSFVILSSVLIKACVWPFWEVPSDENKWVECGVNRSGFKEYALSKYALTLLAVELDNREKVTAVAVNPGNVMTSMSRNMDPWLRKALSIFRFTLISTEEAAANVVRSLTSPPPKGKFYHESKIVDLPKQMLEESTQTPLRTTSRSFLDKVRV